MTGGLLQLVAVGIDSIFLTSNPSITLFKIVYRRYTNFSLTTRNKQIKNLVDFDKEGYYILQKEADCIHKIWLNFDISNLDLSYGNPTREYINEICAKYGFTINYQTDGSNNTIVTPDDYQYIIDEINNFIQNEVNENNKFIDLIYLNNEYNTDIDINTQKSNIIATFKLKLDALYNSYYNEVFDSSGNVKPNKHSVDQNGKINIFCPYMIYVKLLTLKMMFAEQKLISETSDLSPINLNTDISGDYYYLDNNFYNHPEYALGLLYGYEHGDKLNNVYTYAINRALETNNYLVTPFAINDLDKYVRECLLMDNKQNIFLYDSTDNNLNNIKMYHNKIIDVFQNTLQILNKIITGYNPNNISLDNFGGIYNFVSLCKYLNTQIDLLDHHLDNQIYLKIQYKNLIDIIYYKLLYVYNLIYNQYYVQDIFKDVKDITPELLISSGPLIYDYYNLASYLFLMIIDAHTNNTVYNTLYYHEESKFFNMYTKQNLIDKSQIQYKLDLEQILRTYMIDLINSQSKFLNSRSFDDSIFNINEINDILYNEYLTQLTYTLIGTQMYFGDIYGNIPGSEYFLFRDQFGNSHEQPNSENFYFGAIQQLYQCMLLLHIIESNIPNNPNYVDICGNYMGNLSDVSPYYGYKMLEYFNKIIESQNNRNIPILNFNNSPENVAQYIDLDVYKILNKFLKDSDIIYDSNSFSKNFIYSLTQTLKQNQYANIDIFYKKILNSILIPSHHNIVINNNIDLNARQYNNILNMVYQMKGDYYKFIFYKTFTNNVSDTTKFSTILNSNIAGLNDNVINLFSPYTINKDTYEIYFATEILKVIEKMSYNIELIYENNFFIDYFNDINLWTKLLLNSQQTKDILQNLTFDETGNLINLHYYFDASGIQPRSVYDNTQPYYIPSGYNIFDKFISPLDKLIKENIICLNYTPLHVIKDIFSDIYNNIKIVNYSSTYYYNDNPIYINFSLNLDQLCLFDFRDLVEYNPLENISGSNVDIIKNNNIFKNDLYKTFFLNVLLKVNDNSTVMNTDNFQTQIFEQNLFKIADYEYLKSYANNYLITERIALFGLLRPENLIDITKDFSSDNVKIYSLQKDGSGNIVYDASGNPIQTTVQKKLYAPLVRGIIERIRIKLISIIYTEFVDSIKTQYSSLADGIIYILLQNLTNYVHNIIEQVLNNYYIFDNIKNLNSSVYSYTKYKNNGYIFNQYKDYTKITITGLNRYIFSSPNYIYAPSSIWSYINKMQIREYNKLYNEILISQSYYDNNLGAFMRNVYDEFKFRLERIPQLDYPNLPIFLPTNYSQYYYSYNIDISSNIITTGGDKINFTSDYNIYENYKQTKNIINFTNGQEYLPQDIENLSYPVSDYGFDYYAIGDIGTFDISGNNYSYNIKTLDYSSIYNPLTQSDNLIDWYYIINSVMLSIDIERSFTSPPFNWGDTYIFYLVGTGWDSQTTKYTIASYNEAHIAQMLPYYSNLMRIRNKYRDPEIAKLSLSEIIDYFNDCSGGVYKYYSDAEQQIAERVKTKLLSGYYNSYYDILNVSKNNSGGGLSIKDYVYQYTDLSQNPIYPINNLVFDHMQDLDLSGNPIPIDKSTYQSPSHNYFDEFVNYDSTRKQNVKDYADLILSRIIDNINSNIGENYFNGFKQRSDIVKFMIYLIMLDVNTFLNTPFVNNIINLNIDIYDQLVSNTYAEYKLNYFNTIKNITIPRSSNIIITNNDKIKFSSELAYIDLLYHIPDYYTQTDILYYGSELDTWLRNVIYKNPVKYCWVKELGYYLLEYCNFYLDELLIDGYNSNLLSLLDKINGIQDHKNGIDILNGNTEYNITYDTSNKGNLKIKIPLKFYFCKDIGLSIPMINLLYTKGIIKFKTRKIEDLLIYDDKALMIKKPKIKCSTTIQYIYLEEDERRRVAKSKIEFLIEKFRYCGLYKYNKTNLIENKIITRLRIADPTKYILWRIKIIYDNKMQNNYTWNINGYLDENYNPQRITESIKIYFNGSTREQGDSELFNLINPHMRCVGSLEEDEYMYIFALYPLLYQPSGSANMTNIEDVIVEHTFNSFFLSELETKGLNFEIEYWAFGYNILRFMSGMCAPIFYI